MKKYFKKIESNWFVEPWSLQLSDLKEGDVIIFEMEPRDDWNTSSTGAIHKTPVIFHEPDIPCVDFGFFDKYFWGSRYIRVEQFEKN
jgi:hypothetical protein